jgi:hypothetical protein
VRREGIFVAVPENAEQVLAFVAPETGGDFGTVRSAVRNKPGTFVGASQDLDQASLDRSRLDAYSAVIRGAADADPKTLRERSLLLARSLKIELDNECFDKPRKNKPFILKTELPVTFPRDEKIEIGIEDGSDALLSPRWRNLVTGRPSNRTGYSAAPEKLWPFGVWWYRAISGTGEPGGIQRSPHEWHFVVHNCGMTRPL